MHNNYLKCSALAVFLLPCPTSAFAQNGTRGEASVDFDASVAVNWITDAGSLENGISVPVKINGKSFQANIDTGASMKEGVSISYETARRLGLIVKEAGNVAIYAGSTRYSRTTVSSFSFGGLKFRNMDVIVTNFTFPNHVGVILGINILNYGIFQVDSSNHRVRILYDGELFEKEDKYHIVNLKTYTHPEVDRESDEATILVDVCGKTLRMELDTGQYGGISDMTISKEALPDDKTCLSRIKSNGVSTSLNEDHETISVGINSLKIGNVRVGPVIADVIPHDDMPYKRVADGALGLGVLSRFNYAIDWPSQKMAIFGPVRTDPAMHRPTIGLQFNNLPDRVVIRHIMANSPASKSGLAVGDAVCAINGKSREDWHGVAEVLQSLHSPDGSLFHLTTCDGREVKIVARDFLRPPGAVPVVNLTPFPSTLGWYTQAYADCLEKYDIPSCNKAKEFQHGTSASTVSLAALYIRAIAEQKSGDLVHARSDYQEVLRIAPNMWLAKDALDKLDHKPSP